jgi:hypothetical protein
MGLRCSDSQARHRFTEVRMVKITRTLPAGAPPLTPVEHAWKQAEHMPDYGGILQLSPVVFPTCGHPQWDR